MLKILLVSGVILCADVTKGQYLRNCLLRADPGPCQAYMPKYFYNYDSQRCESFVYGGCGGNANRFNTRNECLDSCMSNTIPRGQRQCSLPRQPGYCRGALPAYYYDSVSGRCQYFIYTGCGGNSNRFQSLSACRMECERGRNQRSSQQACWLPPVVDYCYSHPARRFYFNSMSRSCMMYPFNMCGVNANAFTSYDECERSCVYSSGRFYNRIY